MENTSNEKVKSVDYGFPSHLIPPKKKDEKWHLQYIKAFHKEYTTGSGRILRWANNDYAEWRAYAEGRQPSDPYKSLMGIRKRKGKNDPSWLNLDWNILSVMPRMVDVVKNKILNLPYEFIIKATDQTSVTEERQRRSEIVEYMANRPYLASVTTNLPIEPATPFETGEPQPENMKEIDLYMNMFPKNRYAMEMYDQIDMAMNLSDEKQIFEEVVDDGIKVGIGGTKTWIDNIGVIRIRRIVPERTIVNACTKNDFSDMIRIGEYVDITISQLRQRVPRGTFTEQQYADMASKCSGKQYLTSNMASFFEMNNRYAWDHEKVTILECEWFSADDSAYVIDKDENGRMKIITKDDPYWLSKKGITDEKYAEFNKKEGRERELIRDSVNNVYKGTWIVGTEYVFDWGLQSNMIRAVSSLADCESGFTLYTLNFDSKMRTVMPVLDDIQKNWLLYQHYTASAKPPGVAIERRAVAAVTIGSGKNAVQLTPEDILKMYSETGSYIFSGTDAQGKPYPFDPIKELKGGVSEQAAKCYDNILRNIDLVRSLIGLNEFTDSSSPDPRANKDIVAGAEQGTNNALGTLIHFYVSIRERTAKKVCMLVPDAEAMGYNRSKAEALGDDTHNFFKGNMDVNFKDFSLKIELGITTEMRARLSLYVQASLKSNGGLLLPEDAWLIENETNINRAYMILAQKRRQREAEEFEKQKALIKQQTDGQTESAMATEQMRQQTMKIELDMFAAKTKIETDAKLAIEREKGFIMMMNTKLEIGGELSLQEAALYSSLIEKHMTVMGDLKKAQMGLDAAKEKAKNTKSKAAA
jgi:hypothetical protein